MTRRYVLFDLDGTLIDSRAAVTECCRRVFRARLGRDFPPSEIDGPELFAMRPPELFGHVAPDRVRELHDAYRAEYPSCADLVRRFPRARELLLGLVARGRRVGLVTNKGLQRTMLDLGTIALDPAVFSAIVTAEDTTARKSDPAPILLGLERAGALADDAVYIGDGPHDVEAARAAGAPANAVSYGFYDRATLTSLAPRYVIGSIAELAEVLGLPRMAAS